ncbi:MAG: 2OG-Fe(II) oxygenase [Planctomycetota bacterium]|jgi:hypothetical protein|nr:2OG-Fe(II) oxygenase [Planctomycetota bacterium]MDA1164239.1 2OG-Fe(II) oxygenase [Planctomycetota bacterium]
MKDLLFSSSRYQKLAAAHRGAYVSAQPFPHAVLDEFLPDEYCECLLEGFPAVKDWDRYEDDTGVKLATNQPLMMTAGVRQVLNEFNSGSFLEFLETLTGIEGLIPDPYFQGGGLHQIRKGGFLKVHADFNHHRKLNLDRRINVLVYLNRDWQEEFGGHLELWDRSMEQSVVRVLPVFNRCVVFSTTDWSYHGHPEPLNCPETTSRKSLALYYYSNGRPTDEQSESHSTLYQQRPAERARSERVSYRLRLFGSRVVGKAASVVGIPGRMLERIARWIRPGDFE